LSETVSMNICIFRHAVGLSGGAPPPSPPPHASAYRISQSSVRKLWGLRRAPRSSSRLLHHSVFLSCTIPLQRAHQAGVAPETLRRSPSVARARGSLRGGGHGPASGPRRAGGRPRRWGLNRWQARATYLGELGDPREVVAAGVSLREGKGNESESNIDESEPRALRNHCIMRREDEGRSHRVVERPRGLPRVRALQGRRVLRRPPHELLDQAVPRRGSGFLHVLGNVLEVDSELTFSPSQVVLVVLCHAEPHAGGWPGSLDGSAAVLSPARGARRGRARTPRGTSTSPKCPPAAPPPPPNAPPAAAAARTGVRRLRGAAGPGS
jgi:hypothetical protein